MNTMKTLILNEFHCQHKFENGGNGFFFFFLGVDSSDYM